MPRRRKNGIGCGGGVLLDMVLQTVQRACGIDHSPDMVELARQKNAQALSEGRVEIVQGDVGTLPWGENHFTCAAGVEMLCFIEDPVQALRELYRVLKPGGRLVFVTAAQPESALSKFTSAPWLIPFVESNTIYEGAVTAPLRQDNMALGQAVGIRYLRFHSMNELASLLREAGFQAVQVQRMDRSEHTNSAHQLACAVE